ncbi:hypothetical protein SNOG_16233 [Parastagonospora nodorum SN15]|uniref:Uncharacterized protein n=1 Tax=Phaeosphaeria nodorum (strain SN15 / ATCC MYA-4574 / FGSC 10173) TaxID=321614 RepID=Q0TWA8_PHANO|nr:hypothetical protein SNOG_16233 [Parastagonospora nodorum SN15]EAT76417.1 hypothetical protein SNOG_16233 [Parastagonospora nodorum SN15]
MVELPSSYSIAHIPPDDQQLGRLQAVPWLGAHIPARLVARHRGHAQLPQLIRCRIVRVQIRSEVKIMRSDATTSTLVLFIVKRDDMTFKHVLVCLAMFSGSTGGFQAGVGANFLLSTLPQGDGYLWNFNASLRASLDVGSVEGAEHKSIWTTA